ncbi:TPA: hypothetical protein I7750_09600 [Vibrio vulnificus]|uniref:hypothetical protein n=1 Tax=Vibrio TaxID=662 RepID=UPI0002F3CE97|nr:MULTISPECIES: hypothetical protein [Vibrio]ASM97272.1 hypothetical protein AOT11_19355 [Vibrio vulnificus NBRC 15645 = ATCC 27562]EHD2236940.1 hypothetical protein [Vibrio vulnificus]EHT4874238.1 hypothetical protein [Vibrio vulnificus]EHZ2493634.1 hypothetical protein [Vibrio vulnificus]EIA0803891.1 hypothetical protein [Vibrio vulnificus]
MNFEEVKDFLNQVKDSPELLDIDLSVHEKTINEVIRAEKKYLFGIEHTTKSARLEEIEKILLKSIESLNNEDQKN